MQVFCLNSGSSVGGGCTVCPISYRNAAKAATVANAGNEAIARAQSMARRAVHVLCFFLAAPYLIEPTPFKIVGLLWMLSLTTMDGRRKCFIKTPSKGSKSMF